VNLLTKIEAKTMSDEYLDHDFGGHFPGLDNPPALLHDLREIANYWV
jgi:hypothetical protein